MAKERTTGLSFDYIIHPGETIFELLADRDISQKELAIRTGMTEKHISTVIAEKKNISPAFAKRLEYEPNCFETKLNEILNKCGITLRIVPNFKGAPVQGFIKNNPNGSLMLCITIRQKYADIFWFTLFHEIAHILNGDYNKVFVDYSFSNEKYELDADILATDLLINSNEYQKFKSYSNFSNTSIHNFANSQNVADYIVKGRLMHDKMLKWSDREKYMWVENEK